MALSLLSAFSEPNRELVSQLPLFPSLRSLQRPLLGIFPFVSSTISKKRQEGETQKRIPPLRTTPIESLLL